jgi:hypothetical protein
MDGNDEALSALGECFTLLVISKVASSLFWFPVPPGRALA